MGLLLFLLPLPKAGMTEWSKGVFILVVAISVAIAFLSQSLFYPICNQRTGFAWVLPWASLVAVVIVREFIIFQLGLEHMLVLYPDSLIQLDIAGPIRLENSIAVVSIFSAYWAISWMVSRFSKEQVSVILFLLLISLLSQTTYGLIAFAGGQEEILGIWRKEFYKFDVTGTFVNKNHFAGFIAIAWPISVSFVMQRYLSKKVPSVQIVGYVVIALVSLVACSALLASHSRLGILATIGGMVTWWVLIRRDKQALAIGSTSSVLLLVVTFGVLGGLWFGLGDLVERILRLPDSTSRLDIWKATLNIPFPVWLVGSGAGTFEDFYKKVQPKLKQIYQEHGTQGGNK